jgi:hypothetical protein
LGLDFERLLDQLQCVFVASALRLQHAQAVNCTKLPRLDCQDVPVTTLRRRLIARPVQRFRAVECFYKCRHQLGCDVGGSG